MVDDIILTEEEQVQRVKQWWKKNGPSIIFGVVVGLALVFGYNYWQNLKQTTAEQASALYHEITSASAESSPEPAQLAGISQRFKDEYANTPYAGKAALVHAKSLVEAGNLDQAATELRWAADNAQEEITQHVARLRLATVLIEQGSLEQASQTLAISDPGGFDSHYFELQGDIARQQNDYETAKNLYQQAIDASQDAAYTNILQLRLNQMASLLAGQVIEPAKPASAQTAEQTTKDTGSAVENAVDNASNTANTPADTATDPAAIEQDDSPAPATTSN